MLPYPYIFEESEMFGFLGKIFKFAEISKFFQSAVKPLSKEFAKHAMSVSADAASLGFVSLGAVNEHFIDSITNQRS